MERHLQIIAKYSLQVGDRVIVPKSLLDFIQHHAIYVGLRNGDHWFIENKENIGVRLITARDFFDVTEKITSVIRFAPTAQNSRSSLVQKGLRMIGKRYDLLNYNCESFANELQGGRRLSKQVENWKTVFSIGAGLLLVSFIFSND